jgi:plastocyanin
VKRLLLAVVVVAAWIAFAGDNASAATGTVGMKGNTFKAGACPSPSGGTSITVNVGDTVKWTNCDFEDHTVTATTFGGTAHIPRGASYSHTFTAAGSFPYHCELHPPFMKGTVVVRSGGGTTTTTTANKKPIAKFTVDKMTGPHPLAVKVDGSASSDPDGTIVTFTWKWGDGTANSTGAMQNHTYTKAGSFKLLLTVLDNKGGRGVASKTIKVT